MKNSHWAFLVFSCDFDLAGTQPSELKFESQEGDVLCEGDTTLQLIFWDLGGLTFGKLKQSCRSTK
jgi:hypothetical protein